MDFPASSPLPIRDASPKWPQDLGLLVPAYQAEKSLGILLQTLAAYIPREAILVVDDGSTDATAALVKDKGLSLIRHEHNRGKGSALATGLLAMHERGYSWCITMDADGQHRAEDLPAFVSLERAGDLGLVVGQRPVRGTAMPWHRRFSNISTTWMVSQLAGQPVYDAQSGYRMYRTELMARQVWPARGRFEWEAQALILCRRAGWRIAAVPVTTVYGSEGSHMRLVLDTWRFLRMLSRLLWTR